MGYPFLKILFFLLTTTLYIDHATSINHNLCPTTYCGTLSIDYPFQLQTSSPQNNCSYMNLTCNSIQETTIVNLPYGGDFYVRYIQKYGDPYIQLYDPENCLMGRLMKNLNLTSSPFKAIFYENYTFYTCPTNAWVIDDYVSRIDCLSNSTNSTVASSDLVRPEFMLQYGCVVIGSWMLPVLGPGQFEFDGVDGDLYLTWNITTCNVCQDQTTTDTDTDGADNPWSKFAGSPYFISSFGIMAILMLACLLRATRLITGANETNPIPPMPMPYAQPTTATAPPQSSTGGGGLDDSKINSCTELVVLGDNRDSNSCSICLENYHPQELVRSIAKCGHSFHAECIQLWLRKNTTCPVCRMILSEIKL